jgi:DNA primase
MQKVLDNAVGIFDMMWAEEAKGRNFSQPETKAGFRAALEKRARQIANMTVQEFFVHEINQQINEVFLSNGKTSAGKRYTGNNRFPYGKKQIPGVNSPYRPMNMPAKPIRTSRLLREKVLLATMINYPDLFGEFGERLGMMEIPNGEYDAVRQCLIRFLTDAEDSEIYLDDQAVKQHLIESGHGKIVDAIFDSSLYVHAGFAKPGQSADIVRQGWQDAYARGLEKSRWKKA